MSDSDRCRHCMTPLDPSIDETCGCDSSRIAELEAENERLREALVQIDAMDPEDPYRFVFMDQAAIQALVIRMGETARGAIAKARGV